MHILIWGVVVNALLAAPENMIFVAALITMIVIGAVEALGLGSAALGHDADFDADGHWLGWLGVGRLPMLMLIVVFLALFGAIGLIGQSIVATMTGAMAPALLAGPAAAVAALPATGFVARGLARILPGDETTAIDVELLVGLHAHITVGRAAAGSPARARVVDFHGQAHNVLVEPDSPAASFGEGEEVLLVRRESDIFRAVASERGPFSDWIDR
jgi:hypothetical protein